MVRRTSNELAPNGEDAVLVNCLMLNPSVLLSLVDIIFKFLAPKTVVSRVDLSYLVVLAKISFWVPLGKSKKPWKTDH